MLGFLTVIFIFVSVLLIVVVLLQPGKGDLSASLGGISGQFTSMFGTRRAADLLTKLTIGFAASIMILSLLANLFFVGATEEIKKPVTEGVELPAKPATPMQTPQIPPSEPQDNK